jgi:hypothetical protein
MRLALALPFLISCVGDAPGTDSGVQPDGSTDSGVMIDAPQDVGGGGDVMGDAPVKTWCAINAPTAFFCEDFDLAMPKNGWMPKLTGNGNELVGATPNNSPPNALRSITPQVNSGTASGQLVRIDSPGGNPSQWTLEADVWVDITNSCTMPTQSPILLELLTSGTEGVILQFKPSMNLALFTGYSNILSGDISFAPKTWHHVKIITKRQANWYDTTLALDSAMGGKTMLGGNTSSTIQIQLGLYSFSPCGALEVVYDNVVLNVQ